MSNSKSKSKSNGVPKGKDIFKNKEVAAAYDAFASALARRNASFIFNVAGDPNTTLLVEGEGGGMTTIFHGAQLWVEAAKASKQAVEHVMEVAEAAVAIFVEAAAEQIAANEAANEAAA